MVTGKQKRGTRMGYTLFHRHTHNDLISSEKATFLKGFYYAPRASQIVDHAFNKWFIGHSKFKP